MRGGLVQQVGRPWEIYKNPGNQFVASFVGNTNQFDGEVIPGSEASAVVRVGAHHFPVSLRPQGVTKVRVVFRPEELSLSPGECAPVVHELCIKGRVRSSTFTGSLASYDVDCGEGIQIVVERHRPVAEDILAQGTGVTVRIPRAAIYLFHTETGARL
jgi:ABC-type Fe3+/spermidine/putrescine transport system ATPase subunit